MNYCLTVTIHMVIKEQFLCFNFYCQGPEEDQEPESELSISELREQAAKLKRETEVLKQAEIDEEEERERQRQKILDARGCSWGMGMELCING